MTLSADHRKRARPRARWTALLTIVFLGAACFAGWRFWKRSDSAVYLTWDDNPSTTMVVTVVDSADHPHSFIEWRKEGSDRWQRAATTVGDFPFYSGWKISRAKLHDLAAGSRYRFRFGAGARDWFFETAPDHLDRALVFAEGGDVDLDGGLLEKMNHLVGSMSPDFVVLGGDLAYAEADPSKAWRWLQFFQSADRNLVTPDGRLIPVLVTLGNHDTANPLRQRDPEFVPPRTAQERKKCAPYMDAFFPVLIEHGYAAVDFGRYLSLLLMDTRHLCAVDGEQTDWLRQSLAARQDVPNVFPIYHVPAYPCRKMESCVVMDSIRSCWLPLFEGGGVRLAFEHDSHAFKVTHPIKKGHADPDGIIYLGDGAWGVPPREEKKGQPTPWYIEKTLPVDHVYSVRLSPGKREIRALDIDGHEIYSLDQVTL